MKTERPPRDRRHHLRGMLERHVCRDVLEQAHLDRMRALLELTGDVFSREHYAPGHFTASAFVISPRRDRLLLVLHAKLGRWLQPGGHVDPQDGDVVEAALREVAEETALSDVELIGDGMLDVDVHVIPALGGAPAHEHFDVRVLLCAPVEGAIAGSDARAVRWFSIEELDKAGVAETDDSVRRAVAKVRSRFA